MLNATNRVMPSKLTTSVTTVKYIKVLLALLGVLHLETSACRADIVSPMVTTTYERVDENFPNPERGFFIPFNPTVKDINQPLKLADLQKVRKDNFSLVRRIYIISDFRNKPLSPAFLQFVSHEMNLARQAGVKLIIVFTYNWLDGGPDASKNRILSHLDQLKPVLESNFDVIAYLHAGFIGYWGEWNRSTNNLLNLKDMRAIAFKILSVLPPERMVALRYPKHKVEIYDNPNPLTSKEGFNRTYRARTGQSNECFLADSDDWSTYKDSDIQTIESEKNYLNRDNLYLVQGGETCSANSDAQPYIQCSNALKELARMRWSSLNFEYEREVIEVWKTQGCLSEIQRRLGYRFRLLSSAISHRVKPGGRFSVSLKIENEGWASPYNPRLLEIILRHSQTGAEYYLPVQADPRRWMPDIISTIEIAGGIPAKIPSGTYDVLLNLPDPAPKLYNRPEYSIRLANQNTWEAATGYNYLLRGVTIDPKATGDNYAGDRFFKSR